MQTTLGIDLASKPKHTALCVIAWEEGAAEVRALAHGRWDGTTLHDKLLSTAIQGLWGVDGGWGELGRPIKTAIDAPFGWPEPFVQALEAQRRSQPWPEALDNPRERFERRTTDLRVRDVCGKLPLSVSTDRIAYCAMRCAVILGDLARHFEPELLPRDGSGVVAEAYPDAALRSWLPSVWSAAREDSYKGPGETARRRRERIVTAILGELGPVFAIRPDQRQACVDSDDCLDAVVCALLARAAERGDTILPETSEEGRLAAVEGWIHLPRAGGLERLSPSGTPSGHYRSPA
jgi:predicted nuclease with RNAse H fold